MLGIKGILCLYISIFYEWFFGEKWFSEIVICVSANDNDESENG